MFFDIIIIGAGPSGLTTSLSLSKLGLKVCLIEKNDIKNFNGDKDRRAIAISSQSKNILDQLNIWQFLESYSSPIKEIRVTDQYSPLFLHFDNKIIGNKPLGFMVENYLIIDNLKEKVLSDKNITLFCPNKVKDFYSDKNFVKVTLDNSIKIKSKILIAADGKFSFIRDKLNIKTYGWSYNQKAIVCNVRHRYPHNNIAQEMFLKSGPFAILPLQDQYCSSIVWTEKTDTANLLINMDQKSFLYFLERKFTNYLGEIEVCSDIKSYPLSAMFSKNYFKDRIIFIGEVAHSIHPLAGQGFNQTIRDIENLTNLINKNKKLGLDIGSKILLNNYQKERKIDNLAMIAITDSLNRLFSNNNFSLKILRRIGLASVNKSSSLKRFFMNYAMGER